MEFLRDLTKLSRIDERITDLQAAASDTKQFKQLLRHTQIQQPQPIELLNEAAIPPALKSYQQLLIRQHLIIAADLQSVKLLDVRSNSVFSVSHAFGSKLLDAILTSDYLFLLLENSYILLKVTSSQSQQFQTQINTNVINFSRSEQNAMRFKVITMQQLPALAQACCYLDDEYYIATFKGIVVVKNDKIQSSIKQQLQNLFSQQKVMQMTPDYSRKLIFVLLDNGAINVYQKNLRQLKSSIKGSDIISISSVSALESQIVCLIGTDKNGQISYFTASDNACSNIELLGVRDEITFDCLKCYSNRSENMNLGNYRAINHAPGVSLLISQGEILIDLLDQSKKNGITQQHVISYPDNELVRGATFINRPKTGNIIFTQYNQQATKFYTLTDQKLRIYAIKPIFQILQEMLEQGDTFEHYDQCFNLFKQLYSEVEAMALFIYLRCCSTENSDTEKLQQLAQIKYEQHQQELAIRSRQAQKFLEKYQSQEFSNAVKLLVERISWQLLNFQFIYLPNQQDQKKIYLQNNYIPFDIKSSRSQQNLPAFLPFNYCDIFEIAIKLQNIQLFIQQAQDYTQRQMPMSDISQSLEYYKEFLFFLALSLQPENLPRVLPELLDIASDNSEYTQISPLIANSQVFYLTCPKHNVKYYLDKSNNGAVEALVRRLNIVTSQSSGLRSTIVKNPFQENFSKLCKVLSQIFQKRLIAVQLLEEAQSSPSAIKKQKIDQAFAELAAKYSALSPVAPLQKLFEKVDSVHTLVKLLLLSQNDQIRQISFGVQQNRNYQLAIDSSIKSNLDASTEFYNSLDKKTRYAEYDLSTFEDVKAPYSIVSEINLLRDAVKKAASESIIIQQQTFQYQQQQFQITEEQCDDLFNTMQNVLSIIQKDYLFENLLKLQQSDFVQQRQVVQRGMNIIQQTVIACKDQYWHYVIYRFIYWHYLYNQIILEKNALNKFAEEVRDRARDALLSIVSPFIMKFLLDMDIFLYLRYCEKHKKLQEYCVATYNIVQSYGCNIMSAVPNVVNNGRYERAPLNFRQISEILHQAYAKVQTFNPATTQQSLYNTSVQFELVGQSSLEKYQQLPVVFRQYILLSDIQLELLSKENKVNEQLRRRLEARLLPAEELDQLLRQNQLFDLSLVLQYNVAQQSAQTQYVPLSWKGLFVGTLHQDLDQFQRVLIKTNLFADQLQIPLQQLIEKYASGDYQDFIKQFLTVVFKEYQLAGRIVKAALALTVCSKLTTRQQELGGLLCLKAIEHKQRLIETPGDEEISLMRVKRELCQASKQYESWKDALK